MLLTPCAMAWMVLTVFSLCLSVCSALTVTQPYRVVSTNGSARVRCLVQPRMSYYQSPSSPSQQDSEELRVTLLKGLNGTEKLCSTRLNSTTQSSTGVEREGKVQCSVEVIEGAVEVTVTGLRATDTDIYRCDVEVFFPPPYLRYTGNGTLIHVLESSACPMSRPQRQTGQRGEEEEEEEEGKERMEAVTVPVVVLVILVSFVLLIIIYLQIVQCKGWRRETVQPAATVLHKMDAAAAFSC